MLNLTQVNCFVAVAQELNFSRAAQRLNMTQPPLTRQIQMLEHQIGVTLLSRSTRSVKLTPAGKAFLVEAQQLLDLASQATQKAQRIACGEQGQVTLSFVASSIYQYLPDFVNQLSSSHPNISVYLREMTSHQQLNALRLHQVDLGVVRKMPLPQWLRSDVLLKESFVLALPASHELASNPSLSLESLQQKPFISYDATSWRPFYEMINALLASNHVQPRTICSVGSTAAILSLVSGEMGLAIVPEHSVNAHFERVVFRQLPQLQTLSNELLLIWDSDNDNPALEITLNTLRHGFTQSPFHTN